MALFRVSIRPISTSISEENRYLWSSVRPSEFDERKIPSDGEREWVASAVSETICLHMQILREITN